MATNIWQAAPIDLIHRDMEIWYTKIYCVRWRIAALHDCTRTMMWSPRYSTCWRHLHSGTGHGGTFRKRKRWMSREQPYLVPDVRLRLFHGSRLYPWFFSTQRIKSLTIDSALATSFYLFFYATTNVFLKQVRNWTCLWMSVLSFDAHHDKSTHVNWCIWCSCCSTWRKHTIWWYYLWPMSWRNSGKTASGFYQIEYLFTPSPAPWGVRAPVHHCFASTTHRFSCEKYSRVPKFMESFICRQSGICGRSCCILPKHPYHLKIIRTPILMPYLKV